MWLCSWSSTALAQPAPVKRDYKWTETKLAEKTLSADDYRELLTAGSPELAMRVVERLVRDARAGNRDALRATLEIANSKDLNGSMIAATALMNDPKAFDLRPYQLDEIYKNILDQKPDYRNEAWRKNTLDELATFRALTRLKPVSRRRLHPAPRRVRARGG